MKKIGLLILSFITTIVAAANDYNEKWNTHFSYNRTNKVCLTENKVFAIANNHLYTVTKEDGVLDKYTKIDGLSDNNVKDIQYSAERGCLIIVYENSNIDIIESDGIIYNIPDLYNKQLSVNKTINQITIDGDFAYLSTEFGIVVINLKKKEIANTYIIGPDATKIPIYGIAIDQEYIYALSIEYIYKAKKEGSNLLDYNYWQDNKISLNTSEDCRTLYKFSNSLFTIKSDSIVYMYNNEWKDFYTSTSKYAKVSVNDEKLLISGGNNGLICYNKDLKEEFKAQYYTLHTEYDAQNNRYWLASGEEGIKKVKLNETVETYKMSGPTLSDLKRIIYSGDRMYLINGRGSLTDRGYKSPIISYIENHKWYNLTPQAMGLHNFIEYAQDVTSVATDPKDKSHWFFTTFGEGVFEVKDNKIVAIYNQVTTNGEIKSANHIIYHFNRCDGLKYDSYGNLYVGMSSVKDPMSIYSASTGWKNIKQNKEQVSTEWAKDFIFTSKYRAFLRARGTAGIYFWHDNKTPLDPSDDKTALFLANTWTDKDGKLLSPIYLHDAKEDKNGTLWVGTELGPILLQNPNQIFSSSDYRCTRVKINRNDDSGLADYLLDGETIYAIEIDYGNRKWLGTANSGLYLVSEDGTETIAHFTKENSPLSSNSISDLELNPTTGELFIVTPEGVFSYKTDSSKPVKEASKETIYAYPNPVRPEYSGEVIIGGLEDNSIVWITDASGNLVFKGRTVGGSISWDCKNRTGQDVTGGVYMVLVSNEDSDNPNSVATKILVVR